MVNRYRSRKKWSVSFSHQCGCAETERAYQNTLPLEPLNQKGFLKAAFRIQDKTDNRLPNMLAALATIRWTHF